MPLSDDQIQNLVLEVKYAVEEDDALSIKALLNPLDNEDKKQLLRHSSSTLVYTALGQPNAMKALFHDLPAQYIWDVLRRDETCNYLRRIIQTDNGAALGAILSGKPISTYIFLFDQPFYESWEAYSLYHLPMKQLINRRSKCDKAIKEFLSEKKYHAYWQGRGLTANHPYLKRVIPEEIFEDLFCLAAPDEPENISLSASQWNWEICMQLEDSFRKGFYGNLRKRKREIDSLARVDERKGIYEVGIDRKYQLRKRGQTPNLIN